MKTIRRDIIRKIKINNFFLLGILLLFTFVLNASPRQVFTINEAWRFQKGDDPEEIVSIPHSWNSYDTSTAAEAKEYYRGSAWYKKHILIPEENSNKQCYIYFEGANQITKLFVNKKSRRV